MKCLRLFWPYLLLLPLTRCEDTGLSPEEKTRERKLHALARHIRVVKHDPELLDEMEQTPVLELGGLVLRHVFIVNKDKPWLVGHSEFSDEYHKRRRRLREDSADADSAKTESEGFVAGSRHLSEIQTELLKEVAKTPFSFRTPRDRIRLFTVLNGAVLPDAAFSNASTNYWEAGGQVHNDPLTKMMFAKNISEINNASITDDTGGWKESQMGGNFSGGTAAVGNAYRDGQALRGARSSIRAGAAKNGVRGPKSDWKDYYYRGIRLLECKQRSETEPRCWKDAGVAVSVYEEKTNKVIVFHSDWSINWQGYIFWQERAWIIDEMEEQIKNQWMIDSRLEYTIDMQSRGGNVFDERNEMCSFKDVKHRGVWDVNFMASRTDSPTGSLESYGYWAVVKKIVRVLLPETRDRTAEKARAHYFTGSGFGGVWAALSSMYLKKQDDATYDTFVIAGGGWQCLSRSLSFDMSPWADHPQLKVYAHVMDVYARMDKVSGYVCLYGFLNMTEDSAAFNFCGGMVGFTGPQLIHRGKPRGDYESKKTRARVQQARRDFDACHYYTHSPWYAAILFLNDRVLQHDGTTDGGCKEVKPVPRNDITGNCPSASAAEGDCAPLPDTSQSMPYMEMGIVVFGLLGTMFFGGIFGYAAVLHFRNDMWIYGYDKKQAMKHKATFMQTLKGLFGYGKYTSKKAKKHKVIDRAKKARDRTKQKRHAKHDRLHGMKGCRVESVEADEDEDDPMQIFIIGEDGVRTDAVADNMEGEAEGCDAGRSMAEILADAEDAAFEKEGQDTVVDAFAAAIQDMDADGDGVVTLDEIIGKSEIS